MPAWHDMVTPELGWLSDLDIADLLEGGRIVYLPTKYPAKPWKVLPRSRIEIDVREHYTDRLKLVGDDPVANTVAVRLAAAEAKALGGGRVKIPYNDFPVDCTAQIPFEQSDGAFVTYEGIQVSAYTTARFGTTVRRVAGALPVASFVGTGPSGNNRAHGGIRDIELHGGNTDAAVAIFSRCNELDLPKLRVKGADHGFSNGWVLWEEVWNTYIGILDIVNCGNDALGRAAFVSRPFDTSAGAYTANSSTSDSTSIGSAKFENCGGNEIRLERAGSRTLMIGNLNIERQIDNQSWPVIYAEDPQRFAVANFTCNFSPVTTTSKILVMPDTAWVREGQVFFANAFVGHNGPVDYLFDIQRGTFSWGNMYIKAVPTAKHFRFGPNAKLGQQGGGQLYLDGDWSKLVQDERAFPVEMWGTRVVSCETFPAYAVAGDPVKEAIPGTTEGFGIKMPFDRDGTVHFRCRVPPNVKPGTPFNIRFTLANAPTGHVPGAGDQGMRFRLKGRAMTPGITLTSLGIALFETLISSNAPAVNNVSQASGQSVAYGYLPGNVPVLTRSMDILGRFTREAITQAGDDFQGDIYLLGIDCIFITGN